MANTAKLTKPRIRHNMLNSGIAEDRVERALYVYEVSDCLRSYPLFRPLHHTFIDQKNYAIYDLAVVSEIVYRLEVKDKLQHFEQSGRTLSESRSVAKEALEAMDLGAVYINMALQQYEVFCDPNSFILFCDLSSFILIS